MKHEKQMTDLCEARKLIHCCTNAALKKKSQSYQANCKSSLWKLGISYKSKWSKYFAPLTRTIVI